MLLLPSRMDLERPRLEFQRRLLQARRPRRTPIQATAAGVIWDGHHGVRAAAEAGVLVEVFVVGDQVPDSGLTILQLPVR